MANILLATQYECHLKEGEQFSWVKKYHLLAAECTKRFWEWSGGNNEYMKKFLLHGGKNI
jgi:hypothetical protein